MKNGSALTTSASVRCRTSVAKALSKSLCEPALRMLSCSPSAVVAACISFACGAAFGLFGFTSKPMEAILGTRSRNTSRTDAQTNSSTYHDDCEGAGTEHSGSLDLVRFEVVELHHECFR